MALAYVPYPLDLFFVSIYKGKGIRGNGRRDLDRGGQV